MMPSRSSPRSTLKPLLTNDSRYSYSDDTALLARLCRRRDRRPQASSTLPNADPGRLRSHGLRRIWIWSRCNSSVERFGRRSTCTSSSSVIPILAGKMDDAWLAAAASAKREASSSALSVISPEMKPWSALLHRDTLLSSAVISIFLAASLRESSSKAELPASTGCTCASQSATASVLRRWRRPCSGYSSGRSPSTSCRLPAYEFRRWSPATSEKLRSMCAGERWATGVSTSSVASASPSCSDLAAAASTTTPESGVYIRAL